MIVTTGVLSNFVSYRSVFILNGVLLLIGVIYTFKYVYGTQTVLESKQVLLLDIYKQHSLQSESESNGITDNETGSDNSQANSPINKSYLSLHGVITPSQSRSPGPAGIGGNSSLGIMFSDTEAPEPLDFIDTIDFRVNSDMDLTFSKSNTNVSPSSSSMTQIRIPISAPPSVGPPPIDDDFFNIQINGAARLSISNNHNNNNNNNNINIDIIEQNYWLISQEYRFPVCLTELKNIKDVKNMAAAPATAKATAKAAVNAAANAKNVGATGDKSLQMELKQEEEKGRGIVDTVLSKVFLDMHDVDISKHDLFILINTIFQFAIVIANEGVFATWYAVYMNKKFGNNIIISTTQIVVAAISMIIGMESLRFIVTKMEENEKEKEKAKQSESKSEEKEADDDKEKEKETKPQADSVNNSNINNNNNNDTFGSYTTSNLAAPGVDVSSPATPDLSVNIVQVVEKQNSDISILSKFKFGCCHFLSIAAILSYLAVIFVTGIGYTMNIFSIKYMDMEDDDDESIGEFILPYYIYCIIFGLGYGFLSVSIEMIMIEVQPNQIAEQINGLKLFCMEIECCTCILIVGLLWDYSIEWVFYIQCITFSLGLILMLLLIVVQECRTT